MNIRTTITADSVQRIFGVPASIDYRYHPGEGETISPVVIFENMKKKEVHPLENIRILKGTVYTYKNRKIITHWLRDACAAFDLKSTTLCLAIQLTDAYIIGSLASIPIGRCQLAAVTCLWIASKFEETDRILDSREVAQVCDNAYSIGDLVDMEEAILQFFKWCLPHTTVLNHLYLQLHMLGSEDLIKSRCQAEEAPTDTIILKVLVMEANERRWEPLEAAADMTLGEMIPSLCDAARIPVSSNIEVFQVFGENLLVAKRRSLDVLLHLFPLDASGKIRLFVSNGHLNLVFVEHGSFILLRTINQPFLDFCELLIQEAVIQVEFLQVSSHVTALGVLAVATCIMAIDLEESNNAISYVQTKLSISVSKALAAARVLCVKYQKSMEAYSRSIVVPDIPDDLFDRLELCFGRKKNTC